MSGAAPAHPFLAPPRRLGLRRAIKRAVVATARLAAADGGPASVRILTYHRVNDGHPGDRLSIPSDEFRRQMEHLARSRFAVIDLDRAVAALTGAAPLAGDAVVLTFDDGYRDNHAVAAPILSACGLRATFYLATAYVGSDTVFPRYRGCCASDQGMSWAEVRDLVAAGHAIGGHSRNHPELGRVGAGEVKEELALCRADIAREAGVEARHFCYPRGSENLAVRRLVAEAGWASATTVNAGSNRAGVDLFGLYRTEVSGEDAVADFAAKISGRWDGFHRVMQRVRGY